MHVGCGDDTEGGGTGVDDIYVIEDEGGGTADLAPPAPPARATASVEPSTGKAGEPATLRCDIEDADGLPLEGLAVTFSVEPDATIDAETPAQTITATTTGDYEVACQLAEGDPVEQVPATWTVSAGAPANLTLLLEPDQPVYAANAQILVQGQIQGGLVDLFSVR